MTGPSCTRQGRAYSPCPHKDSQEGAPFKCPCRGFSQPQELLGGAGQKEEATQGWRQCLAYLEGTLVQKRQEKWTLQSLETG